MKKSKIIFSTILIALLVGMSLSILSWMNICTTACAEGHHYRIFGLRFEHIGLAFFSTAIFFHLLSLKNRFLKDILTYMVAGALGSEIMFIYAQKAIIGQWCPICLGIAATIFIAFTAQMIEYYFENKLVETRNTL